VEYYDSAATVAAVRFADQPFYPWLRLITSLLLGTIGSCGMYVVAVVLPEIQAEFGTARTGASLPYMLTMIGFAGGSIVMGALTDRFRILTPLLIGAAILGVGYVAAAQARTILEFAVASMVVGFGCSASFGPLIADISFWFVHRRGIAVAIVACGNYAAGALWPPFVQHLFVTEGWRSTYVFVGLFSLGATAALAWLLRPAPPRRIVAALGIASTSTVIAPPFGMSGNTVQALLCLSGVSCCVAMAMPQVHIVALCADLGYGSTRGAEMLSVMLSFGIVSRLLFGWISDHIGGVRTLLLGASLQAVALGFFLPNQSLDVLFIVSALFGLFQGGIIPSYAMIVREYFPPRQAGTRVALTLMATLLGMALGGWASGAIFDLTSSYDAAFVHGIAWNLVTIAITSMLVWGQRRRVAA
jgi:MFS family permease